MSAISVSVLGAGSWGTALAAHLTRCNHDVVLWGRDRDAIQAMSAAHRNEQYLPGLDLPPELRFSHDLKLAVPGATAIVLATPSGSFDSMLEGLKPLLSENTTLLWACKGFNEDRLLHEIVYARLGDQYPAVVLSGPNFAAELAAGLPTATTVASSSLAVAQRTSAWFHNDTFRAYASNDIVGVQLGGALKNIYAIAAGISDGLGFGANARTALITRGLAEMGRLSGAMGGRTETLMGLAGVGDLVLTCTDDQSRNRRFGLAIGRGESMEQAIASIGQVVEGARAAMHVMLLAQKHEVELPIAIEVYKILYEQKEPGVVVRDLLSRVPRNEV